MKTLSVRQPEAWLLVNGIKDVENRTWTTGYRGPLLIHASAKAMTRADWEWLGDVCDDYEVALPDPSAVHLGAIVGTVWLADIVANSESPWWDGESLAWECSGFLEFEPIPCKGKLGLWDHEPPEGIDFTLPDDEPLED